MIDRFQRAQPPQPRFPFHAPLQFACRSDALAVSIHTDADQQLRRPAGPPGLRFPALDTLLETAQVQPSSQLPDNPRRMIRPNQMLHLQRCENALFPVQSLILWLALGFLHTSSLRIPKTFSSEMSGFFTTPYARGSVMCLAH